MSLFDLVAKLTLDSSEYESGIHRAGAAIGSGLGTIASVGAKAIGVATTAVGAFSAASVKTGADFDKSMSQVAATMGLTMDEMENEVGSVDLAWGTFSGNLRDYAQEMGRNTAFSATQAADALNYMALAGYDAQTSMNMLPNVLNLAAAGNFDLARASDMVTDTQTAFGLSLERTSQMVDEMAKAASTGNTSVEQLGDAFLTVGGLAQELNGGMVTLADGTQKPVDGLQELEIALTAMANAGVKGTEAGTHMRNMLLKLSSPTSDGTKQLEALGVAVFDTEGNMRSLSDIFGDLDGSLENLTQEQKIQAISDLFNTRDLASAEALLNAVGEDWDRIGSAILDAEGAAQQMADTQLDNLSGDITLFKSALEGAQIAISDVLTPSLREFVQFGTDGLSRLTGAFKEGGLSGAMSELGNILSEGVAMVIEKLPEFINAGMQLLGALAQGLMDNIDTITFAMWDVVEMVMNAALEATRGSNIVIEIFDWLIGAFNQNYMQLIDVGIEILSNIALGILEYIPTFIVTATDIIVHFAEAIVNALPKLVEKAPEIIKSLVDGIVYAIPELISVAVDLVIALAEALSDPDTLIALVDAAVEITLALMDGLIDAIPRLLDAVPKIISNLVTALVASVPKIVAAGIELLTGLIKAIVQITPRIVAGIPALILAIASGIADGIIKITKVGEDLVKGLWKGIKDRWKSLVNDVKSLGKNLVDGVKNIFGIRSPSKVFAGIGKNLDEGLAKGINDGMGAVDKAMGALEDYTSGTFAVEASAAGNMISSAAQSGVSAGNTYTINIYGERGQDIHELADIVIERMGFQRAREEAVYA